MIPKLELNPVSFDETPIFNKYPSLQQSSKQLTYQPTSIVSKESFDSYLYTINSFLLCNQYKTAIKLILTKEDEILNDQTKYYTLFNLKLKCYFKILDKKIISLKLKKSKPNTLHSTNSINKRLKSIERIFKKLKQIFNIQITNIKTTNLNEMSKEIIIMNYCELLYHQARVSKILKRTQDASAFLSIAHNLLINIADYCKDPYTLSLYQKILLFMSIILIEDKSYFTAIEYNHINLKICLKEIMFRTAFHDNNIYLHEYPDIMKHLSKIVCNIISCFYQMGLCSEHLEEYIHGIESYKETRWFSMEFYSMIPYKMTKLMKETEKVCVQYYNYFKNKQKNKINFKKKQVKVDYAKIAKNKKLSQISSGIVSLEKYNALQSYLMQNNNENMTKSKEAKTIHSISLLASDNRYKENGMLSSVVLYNDLLSRKYKKFLYENSDLNFNYLGRDASDKLEKYNIKLLSNKHIKKKFIEGNITSSGTKNQFSNNSNSKLNYTFNKNYSSRNKLYINNNNSFRSNKYTQPVLCKNNSVPSLQTTSLFAKEGYPSKISLCYSSSDKYLSKTPDRKDLSKYLNKQNKKEFIYKYNVRNSYVFSKTFRDKQRIIEKMENKEIEFQKQIMKIKNKDNQYLHNFLYEANNKDINKIEFEAEDLFKAINEKVNDDIKEKHKEYEPSKKNEELENVLKEKTKLQECVIKSLNVKQIEKIEELEKQANILRKEFNQKNITTTTNINNSSSNVTSVPNIFSDRSIFDIHLINKKNNQILSSLNRDLYNCEKKHSYYEQLLQKQK